MAARRLETLVKHSVADLINRAQSNGGVILHWQPPFCGQNLQRQTAVTLHIKSDLDKPSLKPSLSHERISRARHWPQ